jgi:hypothetical protein
MTSFVSPRSLERASNIVRVRSKIDNDTLIAAMSGAVGEAASRSIQAYVEYQDQLPTWEAIIKNPKDTAVLSLVVLAQCLCSALSLRLPRTQSVHS